MQCSQLAKALTRSLPLTRPFGPPVYVAASQLAPFKVADPYREALEHAL
jgi:hypothetical protein